ncbi:MAG: hypothetical protein COA69_13290 [Robiginitomaculum sp.]|nr:MAG: hypothetical protein COA69_13290 [Robiginitomaculum sp.]
MVDFINEVEEELRKDKYNVLLRKFGPVIVALIFIIVAGAGYVEFQKYSRSKEARAASASYTVAAKLAADGDLQAAIARFVALAEIAPSGYAGLSFSRAAGIKVQLGDLQGAVDLFDRSAQAFTKPIHKDLSRLKAAYILMELGRYDDVGVRASVLAVDDAPYQDLAKELLAHASLKTDDIVSARTQFTFLANAPGVLSGVQGRAKQAVALLGARLEVPDLAVDVEDLTPAGEIVAEEIAPQDGALENPAETSDETPEETPKD